MSEGWMDSAMQVVNQRIKNPLWGFIILAWVWFNWPNLAMLFMSDSPVKFRIDYIVLQDNFYLQFVVRPIIVGLFLAIASPYIQLLLTKAHEWADDRHSTVASKIKERQLKDEIKLAKLQVRAERIKEVINHEVDLEKEAKEEKLKQERLNTEGLEEKIKQLENEINDLERTKGNIRKVNEKYVSDARRHHFDVARLLGLITSAVVVQTVEELDDFKKKANSIISATELDMAVLRNKLDLKEEMTSEELIRIFDYAGEILNKEEESEIRSRMKNSEDANELASD
ncbi:hypothetical protein NGI06_04295 [Citrobacter braakii]|uniref:hypothetical protein n=1 Tax=Citrobacter braakii TaxID=57706 RepID=UPI002DBB0DCC|nr:hypothetical protein [Citrobacter braakii]MEB8217443.1 hypothetical protein [Citrobacter braakii]MEB8301569.1 hypothetical protein [Citrobacter braakii]